MDGLQRLARWGVAVLAWSGALLQLWLSLRLASSNGKTTLDGLTAYLGYFTVLTNLFVASVASVPLLSPKAPVSARLSRAMMLGCATTSICMVGLVYHLFLRNTWSPQGWQWVADTLMHYATPVAMLAYWCLYAQRSRLPLWAPLAWCLYIAGYLAYVMARGLWLGTYPYYFIDAGRLGYGRVAMNSAAFLGLFLVIGMLVLLVARYRARRVTPLPQ